MKAIRATADAHLEGVFFVAGGPRYIPGFVGRIILAVLRLLQVYLNLSLVFKMLMGLIQHVHIHTYIHTYIHRYLCTYIYMYMHM